MSLALDRHQRSNNNGKTEGEEAVRQETRSKLTKPNPPKKQPRLPGMENAAIEELEAAAEVYTSTVSKRKEMQVDEQGILDELRILMKKHGKKVYVHAGVHIGLKSVGEKVKVTIKKDEPAAQQVHGL